MSARYLHVNQPRMVMIGIDRLALTGQTLEVTADEYEQAAAGRRLHCWGGWDSDTDYRYE